MASGGHKGKGDSCKAYKSTRAEEEERERVKRILKERERNTERNTKGGKKEKD